MPFLLDHRLLEKEMKLKELEEKTSRLYTPGLDNTRLFMSLTAGAGT